MVRLSTAHANVHLYEYHKLRKAPERTTSFATIDSPDELVKARNWVFSDGIPQSERWLKQWARRV